jgi:hypothetical protein
MLFDVHVDCGNITCVLIGICAATAEDAKAAAAEHVRQCGYNSVGVRATKRIEQGSDTAPTQVGQVHITT